LKNGGLTHTEFKTYDEYGRLSSIKSKGKTVVYQYNDKNQLAAQIVDKIPIEFTYTRYGQLETKVLGGKAAPISTLKYIYSSDGMIAGRVVDGKFQMYSYDKRGQLLRVADMQGNVAENYVYDPAGNILSKTIDGKTTTYTYDKANQLVSSTTDGKVTHYAYDAAGRLIKEGDKSYSYGWLDKVLSVTENGKPIASFNYHNDGQIAQANHNGKSEDFLWDGLALIHRGETSFINEPYVTGGNPILSSKDGVMFNDMLGSTLNIGGKAVNMTAFGGSADTNAMYTGKPYIGELGYAFLLRNYRSDYGKWQTTDPLGYPDGWNNLAYCNNGVTKTIDYLGGLKVYVWTYRGKNEAWGHASMELDDGTYISWWPEGENRDSIPFVEDIYTADPIKNRTFAQDVAGEDGRMPDVTISINGLDENAIAAWWNQFKNDPNNKWETLSQNCSTTVAEALKAGNASTPWWDFWSSWNIVWTPADVEEFARAINKKLE